MTRAVGLGWSEKIADRLMRLADDVGADRGRMFGHPALYRSRKLAVCTYADGIGLKLPPDRIAALLESGRGTPFQPYGRSAMREWVHLRIGRPSELDDLAPLIRESIAFVADPSSRCSGNHS